MDTIHNTAGMTKNQRLDIPATWGKTNTTGLKKKGNNKMTPNEKLLYVSSHRERNLRLPKMGTDIESHSQIISIERPWNTQL